MKSVLDTYFKNVPTELPDGESLSNLELTTLDKYGTYQIKVSEIYNGSLTTIDSGEAPKGPNGKPLVNKYTVATTSHDKIVGEDSLGNQVVVPDGFKVSNDSGTTVKEGIVIEDSEGNQYVWVPVSNINHDGSNKIKVNSANEQGLEITLGRYTFDSNSPGNPTLSEGTYQYASTYVTQVGIDPPEGTTAPGYYQELTIYRESNDLNDPSGTNTTAKGVMGNGSYTGIKGFIDSVRDNKGYYVARYEAIYSLNGKAGSKESTSSAETLALTSAPSSRTAGDLWNFVKQGEAASACQSLYTTVNSDLMNSYAWDTAIAYIQAMGNTNYANAGRGNNTTLLNTGTTGDEKCKIFDMAGNEREWTTEYYTGVNSSFAFPCVQRGSGFLYDSYVTTSRSAASAKSKNRDASFRSILYL